MGGASATELGDAVLLDGGAGILVGRRRVRGPGTARLASVRLAASVAGPSFRVRAPVMDGMTTGLADGSAKSLASFEALLNPGTLRRAAALPAATLQEHLAQVLDNA